MKIRIAYQPEEQAAAEAVAIAISAVFPCMRRKESDTYSPYRHLYLTTQKSVAQATGIPYNKK